MEYYLPPPPFPLLSTSVAPDPTQLWGAQMRVAPMPTNAPWQNFVLNTGTTAEYLHPYSIQSSDGKLAICYPKRMAELAIMFQVIVADLILSCLEEGTSPHTVTNYDDLSVTLSYGSGRLSVPVVRGCPYVTLLFRDGTPVISSSHAILSVESNADNTKHKVQLNNDQTWLIYCSAPLPVDRNLAVSNNGQRYTGTIRIAALPSGNATDSNEAYLDQYKDAYPVGGVADFSVPFQAKYSWKKEGSGDLLILSLPHQRENATLSAVQSIPSLSYSSMDGSLEGVVGDTWTITTAPISVGWFSDTGLQKPEYRDPVVAALRADVANLSTINTTATYFYGKQLARAARLALIGQEIGNCEPEVEKVREFLVSTMSPWFDNSFQGNGLVYDTKWGGIVSTTGASEVGGDFGLGVYNDHHFHFGYFVYAGAVLAKLDGQWAQKYKTYLYALMLDYMNPVAGTQISPKLRNFDAYKLHSWAAGLTDFVDGRNQESTSEAINAYYAASLLGLAYGDASLTQLGLTLTAFEINAAQALWHIRRHSTLYDDVFVEDNRVVGVLWANKRDSGLWFAAPQNKEMRLGIQMLPITPVTGFVFTDEKFVHELVDWTMPRLSEPDVTDAWKGFTYALQYLYHPHPAVNMIDQLQGFDDGNSKSNLLWWIYTRL
ncbi:endo-1,3(4)-beta-glucanase [Marchantia polymorpha subsp. ruderalis]|nr:hypothetical protein MARPO_0056s0080 [Marchantia polymorpha]BBN14945.1 hypothetical protein Mp_6g15680 [Marchantia polymorpha subsp. ruderalis]|eukprot:PTQ37629.1 hypothetical protein MARPO_0056s0080 [Marchantia polymorpha]